MSYIYIQSEPACWTVGFYDPDGEWQSESDHSTPEKAAERVAYLNGGGDALELRGAIQQLKEQVKGLQMDMIDLKTTAAFAPQIEHLRGQMTELETTIAENAAMRQAIAEARAVIEQLPVAVDPFMPTDAEWAAYPEAMAAATDGDGEMWLYSDTPSDAQPSPIREFAIWRCPECEESISLKWVTPPADFHTTLRHRPSHL